MSLQSPLIRERAAEVRDRIAAACARAGRDPQGVALVAVTKTHPEATVREALAAGLTDLGENRPQELEAKAEALKSAPGAAPPRWHLIGSLQRNKAKVAAEHADLFHALDSDRLAAALQKRCEAADRTLDCLVQVNVSGEASKSGVAPEALGAFLERLAEDGFSRLRIVGLMTLAAPAHAPGDLERVVRPQLARLRTLAEAQPDLGDRVTMRELSMGMSGDYEVAVEEGATLVRLGTALFGARS